MSRVVATAKSLCIHFKEDATDSAGKHLCPCEQCLHAVRLVLEMWFEYFHNEAVNASKKMRKQGLMPVVQLHQAYELGMAVLRPVAGKAVEGYGPL